jgi:hypothetical protein
MGSMHAPFSGLANQHELMLLTTRCIESPAPFAVKKKLPFPPLNTASRYLARLAFEIKQK